MPGLLRWSARRLRSARCGRRRGPAVPPLAPALLWWSGRVRRRFPCRWPSPCALRAARGGRLSARLRARPAPVGRGRGFPGAPVVRGRAAPLRASLPRACCPPSAPAPGGRGRRLRRRLVRAAPRRLGWPFLGWCAARRGFRPAPSRPPPSGPGEAQGYESAAAGLLALRARFPT